MQRGNCYHSSEALYWLLGGKKSGWMPMYMHTRPTGRHWFLQHSSGIILDVTRKQFREIKPDYTVAWRREFVTQRASKKAKALMEQLVWQECAK